VKNVILFIIFFCIGFAAIFGYFYWKNTDRAVKNISLSPLPTNPVPPEPPFSLDQAPKNSIRGQISTMSGTIQWQSRTASEPAILSTPISIQQGEKLVTAEGGNSLVSFADHGTILILPKTDLSIIQTLPVNFIFAQASGSAVFTSNNQIPFSVRSLHLLSTFTEGSMQVNIDEKHPLVTVTMNKGTATLAYNNTNDVATLVKLNEGESYVFNNEKRKGAIYTVPTGSK